MRTNKRKHYNPFVSSWVTIGLSIVLISIVVFQAVMNYNREKEHMSKLLKEKGAALIRSFEAGAKTGMMGMMGNAANMQILLEETASQADISYIFIVDKTGKILAHNNKKMLGTQFNDPDFIKKLVAIDEPQWRVVNQKNNNTSYFEVYKTFLAFLRNPKDSSNKGMMNPMKNIEGIPMECSPGWMKGLPMNQIIDPENRPVIFIGMDVGPFEAARKEDIHNSAITVAVILFLGLAGVVSLFWAQSYMRSRRLLQDTKAFASETIKNLPMGIIVVNKNSEINYINDSACSLLGTLFSDAEKEKAMDLLPGEIWQLRDNVSTGKPIVEKEFVLKTIKGKSAPVNVSVTDIVGEQGDFIGFVFVLKDLSQIKALELKIQRKEKLAALGTFAAGIAHEVRNPLSSIKGYATFFASLFEKESENQKAALIMAQEVDRVDRVISELLEFARPAQLKLEETDIAQFIHNSLRIIKHETEAAGINVITKLYEPLPVLKIDPDRFIQVLLNLYINAIHAMETGGDLTVTAGARKNAMFFEICDTGTGISPEAQANIFNPYFTTKKKGTGLGLAIVYKIIENHNGTIHFESLDGKGTIFKICLPINTDQRDLT
jgi:two-component system sensor histidine kinase HydH